MRLISAIFIVIIIALAAGPAFTQPYLPPGLLNPGAIGDIEADVFASQVIDSQNVYHAVWASKNDYTGDSGGDPDIFYSRNDGTGWSTPVLVNSYGKLDTGANDDEPKLALGPDGELYCVWRGSYGYAGAGTDGDIFFSQNTGTGWIPAEIVNSYAIGDGIIDSGEGITVAKDGRIVVAWASHYTPKYDGNGIDSDIYYSIRTDGVWSTGQLLNSNAFTDSGDDRGPVALAATDEGSIIAAWSTNDPVRTNDPIGTDFDIVWSELPPGGSWAPLLEATALARSDSGDDRNPSVLVIGSGPEREIHIVWESNEPLSGSGDDYDILHTVIGGGLPVFPPANPAWLVNSNAKTDALNDHDQTPSLCIEPGRVLHCAWASNVNLAGLTGTDFDIYQSTNATRGNAWSQIELLGLNGVFDGPGEDDLRPQILCAPNGIMSCIWDSNDDLGGIAGADSDIFQALGGSRGVTRPELVNLNGETDGNNDIDENVAMAKAPDGVIHAVWSSNSANAADGNHGTDFDIFHATLGPAGWSDADLVNTNGISDTGKDISPVLAIDASGTLHAVWSSNSNIGGTSGTDYDIFYAVNSGTGWSTPELVNSNGTTDLGYEADDHPRIAIGTFERVHVVWTRQISQAAATDVNYSWRDGSGWHPQEIVNHAYSDTVQGVNAESSLAMDRNGIPHVAWRSQINYNNAGVDPDIFYSNRSSGAWSDPEFINQEAANDGALDYHPAIAFDPAGITLHAVWASDLDIQGAGPDLDLFYARRQNGIWSDAVPLNTLAQNDSGTDQKPALAVDGGGGLHVTWSGVNNMPWDAASYDFDIYYMNIPPDQLDQWPSAQTVILANASGYADFNPDSAVDIVIDAEGRANFAWTSLDYLGGTVGTDEDIFFSRMNFPSPYPQTGIRHWRRYR